MADALKPITPPLNRKTLTSELGGSGTIITNGFISGEEYNRNLQGRLALQNYDIMGRSDATTHAALQVCKLPILAAHWKFKPASDDPADVEQADFLNREFFSRKIDFFDVMNEGLTCLDFGHAVAELVYELTSFNGQQRWGLAKIASRKQTSILRWATADNQPGILQLLVNAPAQNVSIPMPKLVVFTNEKRGENYEGISLLRFAYKHWYLKDKLEMMNAVALERMGLGIPYVKTDVDNSTNANPDAVAAVETALKQIRVNEEAYLKYPASLDVGFFDMKGNTTKDILPTLEYEDKQILLSVLAQFLGLGQGGASGSRALSQDHSKLFLRSLEAVARTMARGFQSVANRLIDLNYANVERYPQLVVEDLDDDDVATVSDALQKLVTSGVITPGLEVENRGRALLDIKELSQEDWDAKQAEQQKKDEAAQKLAEAQAKNQPQEQQPQPPVQNPKAKQKADALSAGIRARDDLIDIIVRS